MYLNMTNFYRHFKAVIKVSLLDFQKTTICIYCEFNFFLNKSLPARLKATTRKEASRRDGTDLTKTEKDIG